MNDPYSKAFNLALRNLSRRAKTIFEIKLVLSSKGVEPMVTEEVVQRLVELNYLDDKAFARQFIDNRIRFKPKSTFALGYELSCKGVAPSIADELLSSLDNTQLAFNAVDRKQSQWQHLDQDACKKKLMNYLRYRGFDHGVCQAAWQRFLKNK
ncbi:MAG: regulatory protein RecX [Desulfobacter sp.]|nr:regulatory protein RecX [Desulfobacter sp.]WDP86284.1 MAG: regulatory protein RecX [Desulfobacter sp.]